MSSKNHLRKADERSTFGERLKLFRTTVLKMRCKPFCEKFGVSINTLNSWENLGARISKQRLAELERLFRESGVLCDYAWLFKGGAKRSSAINDSFSLLKTNQMLERIDASDFVYQIMSFCYEPIWKKNTKFWLEPIALSDLNSPSFVIVRDQHQVMHIGVTTISSNYIHSLNAYKGSFYTIVLDESYDVFLIKKLSMNS